MHSDILLTESRLDMDKMWVGGRGHSRLLEECAYIAYKAVKEGFPFTVCLLAKDESVVEYLEQRRATMYLILDKFDLPGEVIIDIKTLDELKEE